MARRQPAASAALSPAALSPAALSPAVPDTPVAPATSAAPPALGPMAAPGLAARLRPHAPALLLAAGDVLVLAAFVVVGLLTHKTYADWPSETLRIGTPFILGWLAAATLAGAYSPQLIERRPRAFLARSALAWPPGIGLGLLLRATLFGDDVVAAFALVTLGGTGLFLLGWRGLYVWVGGRR